MGAKYTLIKLIRVILQWFYISFFGLSYIFQIISKFMYKYFHKNKLRLFLSTWIALADLI